LDHDPLRLKAGPRRFRRDRPPALLLGGIDLARALGLAGIPVIVASPEPFTPAMASRYCIGRCLLPPLERRQAVVETLLRAAERLCDGLGARVPLYYGNDDYLGILQEFREPLARRFVFLLNDPAVADALIDKTGFQSLAESRGLPVPRRLQWEELGDFDGRVLVKPRSKAGWDQAAVYRKLFAGVGKARIFASGRRVLADPLARQLSGRLAFQEYVPGDDRTLWSFHGYADSRGELLEWFTGRKIRTYPSLTGESSYLELSPHAELEALGRDIVKRVPLKGVFKIDFKRHADTQRFHVLEVNARFNLWHYLGAQNGVNLAHVAYQHLALGVRPQHVEVGTDYRWLCLRRDFRAYRELASRGELDAAGWLRSLAESRKVYHLFAWNDPLPAAAAAWDGLLAVPRRTRRVLTRWLSTAS
jgi:D-aspartate ligase